MNELPVKVCYKFSPRDKEHIAMFESLEIAELFVKSMSKEYIYFSAYCRFC